jgi:hypothetical protein
VTDRWWLIADGIERGAQGLIIGVSKNFFIGGAISTITNEIFNMPDSGGNI